MAGKKTSQSSQVIGLSGGTGRTCEQVLQAALAQFEKPDVNVVLKSDVHTVGAIEKTVKNAAQTGAVICHTVVDPKLRDAIARETKRQHVPTVDLLGPVVSLLDDHLEQSPRRQPGLSYQLRKEHFDRIDAVDFTLAHDDGTGMHDLAKADVVLVGISRVSKSVTCFYLSYQGVRSANVPLITDHDPPEPLLKLDPRKVVGLTMNANRLQSVREARIKLMGKGPFDAYGSRRDIMTELRTAESLMARHGWRTVDVSYKSTEEVAKEVLSMIEISPSEGKAD